MEERIYQERLQRLIDATQKEGLDAFILYSDVWRRGNVQYISGWREAGGGIGQASTIVFVMPGLEPVLFVGFEQVLAARQQSWIKRVERFDELDQVLRELAPHGRVRRVGLAGLDIMPVEVCRVLERLFGEDAFVDINPLLWTFRRVKSPEELELMRKAAAISDEGIRAAIAAIREGVSEAELATVAKARIAALGADLSFCPVVGFGEDAAQAMRHPRERRLKRGEAVLLDFGALYNDYAGDTSRTVAFGELRPEMRRILDTALTGHERACAIVRPGVHASAVDEAIRRTAEEAGLGRYVIHDAGHGVGIDQEENFPVGPSGSDIILVPNMTFTIEAGIYVPNVGGVRIEDVVVVTADGVEILNKVNKDIRIG